MVAHNTITEELHCFFVLLQLMSFCIRNLKSSRSMEYHIHRVLWQ